MIAMVGGKLVLLSLAVAVAGAIAGFAAGGWSSSRSVLWIRRLARAYAALMILANLFMLRALLARDFSVAYVAQVGSLDVPDWVAFVSLWSSLEGSLLFWGLVLGLYVFAAVEYTASRHPDLLPYAAGTWLVCGAFFSFLASGPTQPFAVVPDPPFDGPGPNPLLQNHVLMAFHPPLLYFGYVGTTIPFGLAVAALLTGRLGPSFVRSLRLWLIVSWIFLSIAIMLGGWWAYEVLGWGGYWAWDPVENASLLPWLTATAAFHSMLLLERRRALAAWTLALVMGTFLLTILGTFMTRSGVFNSVHAFSQSAIGPTILALLALAVVFSLALLSGRIDRLKPGGQIGAALSREGAFLVNNLLLLLITFTILLGTVFPMAVEALRGVKMSVGRPYFDAMTGPMGVALLLMIGVGSALPWGGGDRTLIGRALVAPLLGAAVAASCGWLGGVRSGWALLTLLCGGYTTQAVLREMARPFLVRLGREKTPRATTLANIARARRAYGAHLSHIGAVVVIVAIAVSHAHSSSQEIELTRSIPARLGEFTLTYLGSETREEPHRISMVARVELARPGRSVMELAPRMVQYAKQRDPVGTPAVRMGPFGNYYMSPVRFEPATSSSPARATVEFMIHPLVGWIWIGVLIMAAGGVIVLVPARGVSVTAVNDDTQSIARASRRDVS
ncbi:MAG: heme lyase CcmF/NrfE family subunit [Vicinamibacteria bacterium]|nr:heme lyase CcmF/NrfE family subunit [Vicinamibacteria bacterium]